MKKLLCVILSLALIISSATVINVSADNVDINSAKIYSFDDLFVNREITLMIYDLMTVFLRDVLLDKNSCDSLIINKDKINDIKAFSRQASAKNVTKLIEIIANAGIELGKSGNISMSRNAMFVKCREVIHD